MRLVVASGQLMLAACGQELLAADISPALALVVGGLAAVGIIGTGIGVATAAGEGGSALEVAAEDCDATSEIQDDGSLYPTRSSTRSTTRGRPTAR